MAVGDIINVDINFTFQGNPNVYCYVYEVQVSDFGGTDDEADVANAFFASNLTAIVDIHDATVQFDCLVTQRIFPSKSVPIITAINLPGGDAVGVALPGQCSMVSQLLPGGNTVTPRTRGRDFWTGFQETDQADGQWTLGKLGEVRDIYVNNILVPLTGPNDGLYNYGIFSATQQAENVNPDFVSNGGTTPDPDTFGTDPFTPIVKVQLFTPVRTQRRRQLEDPCLLPVVGELP